jgi:acetyl esterase/lipase
MAMDIFEAAEAAEYVAERPAELRISGANPAGHSIAIAILATPTTDDPVDPVENSVVYYAALRKAGVSAGMHLYAKGGHAFVLRPTASPITAWPTLVEKWLKTIGDIEQ